MTASECVEKIVELIAERPPEISADKLLYLVYVRTKIAEGLRAVEEGRVYSHKQVEEGMWQIINSKSSSPRINRNSGGV